MNNPTATTMNRMLGMAYEAAKNVDDELNAKMRRREFTWAEYQDARMATRKNLWMMHKAIVAAHNA